MEADHPADASGQLPSLEKNGGDLEPNELDDVCLLVCV